MKNKLLIILMFLSALVTGLLFGQASVGGLVKAAIVGALLGAVTVYLVTSAGALKIASKPLFVFGCVAGAAFCFFGARVFFGAWDASEATGALAAALHIPAPALVVCSISLGLAAFPSSAFLCCVLSGGIRLPEDRRICGFVRSKRRLFYVVVIVAFIVVQHIQLQYASLWNLDDLFTMRAYMFFVNSVAILAVTALLGAIFGNIGTAMIVTSVLSLVWSIADYFVTLFHGSPLFFSEFGSFGTAMNVMGGYSLTLTTEVSLICALFVIQILLAVRVMNGLSAKNAPNGFRKKHRLRMAAVGLVSAAFALVCYNIPLLKPKNAMNWSWKSAVKEFGYIACTYEDVVKRIDPVTKPQGYSEEKIDAIPIENTSATDGERPDIIFILNESFFDLGNYADIETDVDYLGGFYSIEGAHYGFACQPTVGGGTNNSEMEFLTSNSMYLLPISAPFSYLDFTENRNSLADCLAADGYSTLAMHIADTNYSRHIVYPQIGFEETMLGAEHFKRDASYENRRWTDIGNYEDMEEAYNAMGDGPRFVYLLTYQNHGGYRKNDDSWDRVHVKGDFGELNSQLDEYMTSIAYSAEAFVSLTEYYRAVDRPVIICMVGDHAPTFISQLPAKEGLDGDELEITERLVPYVVWSNRDIEWSDSADRVSLVDLAPLVKKAAGLPLSTYDNRIIDLHDAVPIRTSTGLYITADGEIGKFDYGKTDTENEMIRDYLFMEYNLLKGGDGYRAELFEPAAGGK